MKIAHKASVLKQVRKAGVWRGYIAPSNVNSAHIKENWCLGTRVEISLAAMSDRPSKYIVTTYGARADLEKYIRIFMLDNCNSELGNRIRFWEDAI